MVILHKCKFIAAQRIFAQARRLTELRSHQTLNRIYLNEPFNNSYSYLRPIMHAITLI